MAPFKDLTDIPIIDSHVHVFPDRLFEALKNWFETYAWKFSYDGTAEEFVQAQFDNGIAGSVLMAYAHRPEIARGLNEFTGELLRQFPHTVGLAAIHPEDENPQDIVKHAFEECGLCGVKIHCHVITSPPDDPLMMPIYESVIAHDGIINIHAGREPSVDGYGADVRSISGAARVEKVLRRFPDLKMIIPHLGIDETDRFCDFIAEYPNLYLDTAMVLGDFFPIEISREMLIEHADRILFGTDYPHIPFDMEWEVRSILKMDLGENVLRRILFENAAQLFPIQPRP